jgi:hypothetical protein
MVALVNSSISDAGTAPPERNACQASNMVNVMALFALWA